MNSTRTSTLDNLINLAKQTFTTASNNQIDLTKSNLVENAMLIAMATIVYTARTECINKQDESIGISSMTGDTLIQAGIEKGYPPLPATQSKGFIVCQTDLSINENIEFNFNSNTYICYTNQSSFNWNVTVQESVYSGATKFTTVTLKSEYDNITTDSQISLVAGLKLKLSTAPNTEITIKEVLSRNQFTVSDNVSVDITSNKVLTYTSYKIPVTSIDTGEDKNVLGFTTATSDSLPNIICTVDIGGLTGGADKETESDYRARLIKRAATVNKGIYNDVGFDRFLEDNNLDYQYKILRAYKELTFTPGYSTNYLLKKDNIPLTTSELNHIMDLFFDTKTGLAYPNEIRDKNQSLFLNAVTTAVNINLTALIPDYQSLRQAIEDRLTDFFKNDLKIGESVSLSQLEGVVYSALDNNNNKPKNFTITSPNRDLICALNERLTLGKVTWGGSF